MNNSTPKKRSNFPELSKFKRNFSLRSTPSLVCPRDFSERAQNPKDNRKILVMSLRQNLTFEQRKLKFNGQRLRWATTQKTFQSLGIVPKNLSKLLFVPILIQNISFVASYKAGGILRQNIASPFGWKRLFWTEKNTSERVHMAHSLVDISEPETFRQIVSCVLLPFEAELRFCRLINKFGQNLVHQSVATCVGPESKDFPEIGNVQTTDYLSMWLRHKFCLHDRLQARVPLIQQQKNLCKHVNCVWSSCLTWCGVKRAQISRKNNDEKFARTFL